MQKVEGSVHLHGLINAQHDFSIFFTICIIFQFAVNSNDLLFIGKVITYTIW